MVRQAQQRVTDSQTSRTYSRPAPIGGWNARDSLANMKDGDAVILTNMIPRSTSVDLRDGSRNWVTGFGVHAVNTLAGYNPATGAGKLFAASDTKIYDVTTAGALGAAVVTGLTSDKWQHTNVSTAGGKYLVMVNGTDKMLNYDGAAWVAIDGVSAPAITGVTTSTLIHVCLFATRLFFVQKDTLSVWYLPVLSIAGVASELNFATIFRKGGYMMAMDVWTIDGGYGMDDYAAFVTSEGEVAIYKGTDPSAAGTWVKVGLYQAGAPCGRRCFMKYGGDLVLICKDGLVSMSSLLASTRVNSATNLTYKIQTAITDSTFTFGANFGWQSTLFPNQNLVVLNVPKGAGIQEQYIMNTITGSWANFTGWYANCWERFGDEMYYGTGTAGTNAVIKAMVGQSDNDTVIIGTAVEAFSYFGPRSLLKSYQMVRPILLTNGTFSATMNMVTDFDVDSVVVSVPTYAGTTSSVWDTALWDSGVWGGGNTINKDWQYADGYGYSGALKINISSNTSTVSWVSTDYLYSIGSVM